MREQARKNLSTGIYVRVSTEEQAQEGYSIRGQTEKLKSYALLKEWDIFDIYADEGISGKNITERPAINRLIEDIQSGKVNNVLVFKVDRLTRSTRNLLELVELFEDCNCAFNSLTESIDTDTPSGRMFLKIIGIFAEFERENLASRLKLGFERKVKEGYTLASYSLSYGYTKDKGEKIQKIHPEEAKIVKEIFSMFVEKNFSLNKIAKILNKRKIATKKLSTWQSATIRFILINPTYIGKVRYSIIDESKYFEVDGQHERIITDDMFYLAQEKIKNTAQTLRTKRPREESYFCGVLYCSSCKEKFTTHNFTWQTANGEKQYGTSYRCRTKMSCGVEKCKSPNITHEKMELAFREYIQKIGDITEDENIVIDKNDKNESQEILKSIVDCEKKLNTLQNRKNQVMEQYVQGVIEFNEYKDMIKLFNENYEVLENELHNKKTELGTVTKIPEILPEDVILNLKQNWEYLNNTEKATFLHRFIKKIFITTSKERANSNIVKIDNIEFHTGEIPKREQLRSKLR